MIFVFGSNLAGRHGKGAALYALKNHGAKYGQGWGRQGTSYAIPTKDWNLKPLKVKQIEKIVDGFLRYATEHPELQFQLTPIGCGLAGYKPADIAPLFTKAPSNVNIPVEFQEVLNGQQYSKN